MQVAHLEKSNHYLTVPYLQTGKVLCQACSLNPFFARALSLNAVKVRDNQVVALHPSTGITHKPEWVPPSTPIKEV